MVGRIVGASLGPCLYFQLATEHVQIGSITEIIVALLATHYFQ